MSDRCHLSRRNLIRGAAGLAAGVWAATTLGAEPSPVGIWDCHVHLSGSSGTPAQRIDKLLECAARLGIEKIVVSMGLRMVANPTPDELRRQNDDVLAAIAHAPAQVLGWAYLSPQHVDASLAELERCVAHGPMVGVKLWIAQRCHEPSLDPLVRRAIELHAPILQHTYRRVGDNLPGESTPQDLAALAARHPAARFIAAHVGGDWEQGIRAVRATPNVLIDTCGFDPTAGFVEMALRELGPGRILFGSDAGGRSFASQLAKVESADLPADDRRRILRDNLWELLAPVLAAKGPTS